MLNKLQNDGRSRIIFILMAIMIAGLFVSRVLLSAAMIAFVLFTLFHADFKKQLTAYWRSPLLIAMGLLFFLPALSFFWSSNHEQWLAAIRIKLPLLVLPFVFAAPFGFTKKHWVLLALVFILFVTGGSVWSFTHYLSDIKTIQENYLRSRLLVTPLENDHVLFSWMVSAAILFSISLTWYQNEYSKKYSMPLRIISVWLIIFLHILSARTGLISFYLMFFIAGLWLVFKKTKPARGVFVLFLMAVLPLAAYLTLPTFQNRVKYFLYDLPYFSKAHYKPGLNDAVRILSMKAGWNVMKENPFTGVGYGDIYAATQKWYKSEYPDMKEEDKILPSSQCLMYGAGCGWPGLLLCFSVMAIPFFINKLKTHLPSILIHASVWLLFIADNSLEVQFGVFLYSFVVLCSWKWCTES
jgi:O-antigen ligase